MKKVNISAPLWAWLLIVILLVALAIGTVLTVAKVDALTEAHSSFVQAYASETVTASQCTETEEYVTSGAGYADVSVEIFQEPLGDFRITYYCPCEKCCGSYADGITASGVPATEGVTCACDYLPIGTMVNVDGHIYTVQDRFGAFDGSKCIDIYVEDHDRAEGLGTHTSRVYLVTLDNPYEGGGYEQY